MKRLLMLLAWLVAPEKAQAWTHGGGGGTVIPPSGDTLTDDGGVNPLVDQTNVNHLVT